MTISDWKPLPVILPAKFVPSTQSIPLKEDKLLLGFHGSVDGINKILFNGIFKRRFELKFQTIYERVAAPARLFRPSMRIFLSL